MDKSYKLLIFFFILLSVMFLTSSVALFSQKIGFSEVEKHLLIHSLPTLFKVSFFHLLAFGVFIFVILHFLLFTPLKHTKHFLFLIHISFVSALCEIGSSLLSHTLPHLASLLKLGSFFSLHVTLLYALGLLFVGIVKR